jgi:HPt (histidine-containing phosphotransfer) domain-containing protein
MAADGDADFGTLDGDAIHSLLELLDEDREALSEIVDAFVEEAPQRLAEVREGTEDGDPVLVRRAAHTLKANGRTFGAGRLAQLSEEIETAARGGDLGPASTRIDELDEAWREIRADLQALRTGAGE